MNMQDRQISAQRRVIEQSKIQNERLTQRIAVLETRNRQLRAEVERLTLGEQAAWTDFEPCDGGIFGDGRVVGVKGSCRMYVNSRYTVSVFRPDGRDVWHLSIKRNDGAAVRDWRDFQRIKNELLGDEYEACELYPAEARLVDGANQYHLWAIHGQFPFGFGERLVSEDNNDGVQQRPWEDEQRPDDLTHVTGEQMARVAGLED
jgi:hypothetical protein